MLKFFKKTKPLFAFLILLFISLGIATTVFLVQRRTQLTPHAQSQPTQITAGSPYNLQASGLLPNKNVNVYIWKMRENPVLNPKIGMSGVYLHWENYPNIVNLFNSNYGDKIIGTTDDVTSQMLNRKHLSMLKAAGVKTIAFEVEWGRIEPQQNNWTWSLYDTVFEQIKYFAENENYYFEPVVMLSFSPPWITSAPAGISKRSWYPPKDLWINNTVPTNPDDNLNALGSARYNKFVEEVVKRYRPRGVRAPTSSFGIRHWVIWNETNWEFFRDPTDTTGQRYMPSMKPYAYLFKGAADSIHTVDSSLKVLPAGFADGDYSWAQKFADGTNRSLQNTVRKFYEEMKNAFGDTAKNSFDILNVHTYLPTSTLQQKFSEIASIKSQYNDAAKKIWITEWGCDAQECLTDNLSQTLSKWQEGKRIFDGTADIEKHLWFSSKGYFLNNTDAQTATTLQATSGRSADQWWIFAGMLYSSYKPKTVFGQLAKDTRVLETEQIYNASQKPDANGNFQTSIPGSYFSQPGKYLIFFAQDERVNTELPIEIRVVTSSAPTTTSVPTQTPSPRPTTTPTQGGNYTIKVQVKAEANGGVQPNLLLFVNHPLGTNPAMPQAVTQWTTSSGSQEYTSTFNYSSPINQIDLTTTNNTGNPNYLVLESVSLNNVSIYPVRATCFFDNGSDYRAFDQATTNSSCTGLIWANGSFRLTNLYSSPQTTSQPTPTTIPPRTSNQTITVSAKGYVKGTTVYPELKLYINYQPGVSPVTIWKTSWSNQNFTYTSNEAVGRIDILFDNQIYSSTQNTFPYIYSVKLGNNVIYSLSENAVYENRNRCNYDRGRSIRAFDNEIVVQCQNPMFWPGALRLTDF